MSVHRIRGTPLSMVEVEGWAVSRAQEEPLGLLCVWEGPQFDGQYTIGVDTADGVGADRGVIQVLKSGGKTEADELVAEWAGNATQLDMAPILFGVAQLYSPQEEALLAIELNRGDTLQHEIRMKYGWSNLYRMRFMDRVRQTMSSRLGWYTDSQSRPKMLSRGIQWVRDRKLRINSPWLANELADFEYSPETQKMKAAVNRHDDRVIAAFIALYCSRDWAAYEDTVATVDQEDSRRKPPSNPQLTDISVEEAERGGDLGLYY